MGQECQTFYSRLSERLAEKRDVHWTTQSQIWDPMLKPCLLCLRVPCSRNRNVPDVQQNITAQYEVPSIK